MTVSRGLRIIKCLRLVRFLKSFRRIFETLVLSLPSLINVAILILLLLFVYATAGTILWGNLNKGVYITSQKNFESFYSSFILLFISSTGEDWNFVYLETYGKPGCDRD